MTGRLAAMFIVLGTPIADQSRLWQPSNRILIFDNADELDVINGFSPTAAKGSVVIASRNSASVC